MLLYNPKTVTKYYAYTKPWTQPVCTSNTSHGNFTGGGYFSEGYGDRAYYHVSDNSWPTSTIGSGGWDGTCWATTHNGTGWFNWELPTRLRITGIIAMARNYAPYADYYIGTGYFKAGTNGIQIGDTFSCTSAGQKVTVANIPETGIITDNLYFYKDGGAYSGLAEIWITAYTLQEITKEEYVESSYSYSVTFPEIKALYKNEYKALKD